MTRSGKVTETVFEGVALAAGQAVGTLYLLAGDGRDDQDEAGTPPADRDTELQRFQRETGALAAHLERAVGRLEAEAQSAEAGIVRAHVAMLQDPEFHRLVHERIEGTRYAAEQAVEQVLDEMVQLMAAAGNDLLAERAADFRDLAVQLRSRLTGQSGALPEELEDVAAPILAVDELLPSLVLEARAAGVQGFVVARGTELSHGAILAKGLGLPAVRIGSLYPLAAHAGARVVVNGTAGRLVIDPEAIEAQPPQAVAPAAPIGHAAALRPLPARLWLSVVDPAQLEDRDWEAVEGVGLYRTETLFLQHRHDFPDETEQLQAYHRLFAAAGTRPVVVRTADLGADKTVAHMSFGPQLNPYLGLRAHRLYRFHPELLLTQVRAILRAAAGDHRARLMFPMVETPDRWHELMALVDEAVASLQAEGVEYQRDFERGLLVETPSAAFAFAEFLSFVDFASVGTNDLVQYFFAVERDAANVADSFQPEHPVFLRLLEGLAAQAAQAGKPLSVCGEVAGDPDLAALLVGLGIAELSVAPPRVDAVRQRLAGVRAEECRDLARACLKAADARAVRGLLGLSERQAAVADHGPGDGRAIDPVCGMVVDADDNPFVWERAGQRQYFCSARCLRRCRHQAPGGR